MNPAYLLADGEVEAKRKQRQSSVAPQTREKLLLVLREYEHMLFCLLIRVCLLSLQLLGDSQGEIFCQQMAILA